MRNLRGNVHLTTVIGSFVKVFPFMIEHYRQLGIDSAIVNVHLSSEDDPVRAEIERAAHAIDCPISSWKIGDWQSVFRSMYRESRAARPHDWFILADQDELQCYPDDVMEILRWCDRQGYDCVRGCFVDRLARNGELGTLENGSPIWDQFPLAGLITLPIAGADPRKIVAAKGHVNITHGQHAALSGRACPLDDVFVQVHHFKWTDGLYEHLRERAELLRRGNHSHWVDSAKLLAYLDAHKGRFDIACADLMIEECGRDYPHWDFVRQAVREYEEAVAEAG